MIREFAEKIEDKLTVEEFKELLDIETDLIQEKLNYEKKIWDLLNKIISLLDDKKELLNELSLAIQK